MGNEGGDGNNEPSKMYSADVVAAVLMASGTTSLSMKQYEMMSALDGTRTASSFQHSFRAVLARARELKARVDAGETFDPVQPTSKRAGGANTAVAPSTPKKRKYAGAGNGAASPRKDKVARKGRTTDGAAREHDGSDNELPQDTAAFVKDEPAW